MGALNAIEILAVDGNTIRFKATLIDDLNDFITTPAFCLGVLYDAAHATGAERPMLTSEQLAERAHELVRSVNIADRQYPPPTWGPPEAIYTVELAAPTWPIEPGVKFETTARDTIS